MNNTRGIVNSISHLNNRNFYYCDVGARGGISELWKNFSDIINIIGFEPDAEEYKNLLKNKAIKLYRKYFYHKKNESQII